MYYYGYSFGISIHQREKVEILVDEVYTVIILADRACEKRNDRRHRDHKAPLDAFTFEDRRYFGDENTPETILIEKENCENLIGKLDKLSDIQKRRLLMYLDGMTCEEIANVEHVPISAVAESLRHAKEKLKILL